MKSIKQSFTFNLGFLFSKKILLHLECFMRSLGRCHEENPGSGIRCCRQPDLLQGEHIHVAR